jgi:hypothetical protein
MDGGVIGVDVDGDGVSDFTLPACSTIDGPGRASSRRSAASSRTTRQEWKQWLLLP